MGSTLNKSLNNDSGAYIFKNNSTLLIDLLIYIKLSPDKLLHALPISYDPNKKNANYLVCIFEEGRDYLSQNTIEEIDKNILEYDMINLLDNSYETLYEKYPDLSYDLYKHYIESSRKNLYK